MQRSDNFFSDLARLPVQHIKSFKTFAIADERAEGALAVPHASGQPLEASGAPSGDGRRLPSFKRIAAEGSKVGKG